MDILTLGFFFFSLGRCSWSPFSTGDPFCKQIELNTSLRAWLPECFQTCTEVEAVEALVFALLAAFFPFLPMADTKVYGRTQDYYCTKDLPLFTF